MTDKQDVDTNLVVIRSIPGFLDLETEVVLRCGSFGDPFPTTKTKIDRLSEQTFGATEADVHRFLALHRNDQGLIEKKFAKSNLRPDLAVDYLLSLNFDFRDESRNPLKLTEYFKFQAAAAAKGILGKVPDFIGISRDAWGHEINEDAEEFKRRKKFINQQPEFAWPFRIRDTEK